MKALFAAAVLTTLAMPAVAQNYVSGYTNNHGTYVQPYYRSEANSTQYDNYSSRGNTNPYTGAMGTRIPRY